MTIIVKYGWCILAVVETHSIFVVTRFVVDAADAGDFAERATVALATLAARPGYRDGRLGRALDEPGVWCLAMRWSSVGDYRRALSSYEVKLHATPLLAQAVDEVSAFEELALAAHGGPVAVRASDRTAGDDDHAARPEPNRPGEGTLRSPS
jgi:hypothetical protein